MGCNPTVIQAGATRAVCGERRPSSPFINRSSNNTAESTASPKRSPTIFPYRSISGLIHFIAKFSKIAKPVFRQIEQDIGIDLLVGPTCAEQLRLALRSCADPFPNRHPVRALPAIERDDGRMIGIAFVFTTT
jgi:hypothetical protein